MRHKRRKRAFVFGRIVPSLVGLFEANMQQPWRTVTNAAALIAPRLIRRPARLVRRPTRRSVCSRARSPSFAAGVANSATIPGLIIIRLVEPAHQKLDRERDDDFGRHAALYGPGALRATSAGVRGHFRTEVGALLDEHVIRLKAHRGLARRVL